MSAATPDPAALFLARAREYLGVEYRMKIRRAVEALPPASLWWRPDEGSNSVGNLLLHLAGNVRQWIVCGIGGAEDARDRAAEFSARQGPPAAELLARLERVLDESDAALARQTAATLVERRRIQGRDVTVLDAIFDVVQHFSMHLGQIIAIAKERAPGRIQFYDDAGGLARPLWREQAAPE